MKRLLTLPALLVQSVYAAAIVRGLPLRGSDRTAYKTVECRGPASHTAYRGAIAIFASKSYQADLEDHIAWWHAFESERKRRGNLVVTPEDAAHVKEWCQKTRADRYRLVGFAQLEESIRSADVLRQPSRKMEKQFADLHRCATDFRGEWMNYSPPDTYFRVSSLAETKCGTGPEFTEVCTGCNHPEIIGRTEAHNPTACHVNVQTVSLSPADVPNHVTKEIGKWPLK